MNIDTGGRNMRVKPRHIKHTSIHIGDTIKVSGMIGDLSITKVGIVAKRDQIDSTTYETAEGYELLMVFRDGTTYPTNATVTLLSFAPDLTLF